MTSKSEHAHTSIDAPTPQVKMSVGSRNSRDDPIPEDQVFVHKLRVSEAKVSDAGRNIVRIDGSSLILLGINIGDIIIISGENGFRAAAECLDSELLEMEPVIRMDKVMRTNLGLKLDDLLDCTNVSVVSANSIEQNDDEITLDPLLPKVPAVIDESYVAEALEGMPVTAGQAIVVPYFGGNWYPFIVMRVKSRFLQSEINQVAIVGPKTKVLFGASGLSL